MNTPTYMTQEELPAWLKSLGTSDLEGIAQGKGLVIGGSGKGGNVTKKDLVNAIGASMIGRPTHYQVQLEEVPYHNGGIVNRQGVEWRVGEKRVISVQAYQQISDDVGEDRVRDRFRILDKVNVVEA